MKIKYFLVMEKRLGDYNVVDINKLDICKFPVANELDYIDTFTSMFTENEIKASIERGNLVHTDYLNGNLKVISDVRHNFKVLTKDMLEEIKMFQIDNEVIDKDLKNKMFSYYKKTIEIVFEDKGLIKRLLERFKKSLKNGDKREIFEIIQELPYNRIRNLYLIIYDDVIKRKEEKLRKLEKLDA